jgi:hypothetical protein
MARLIALKRQESLEIKLYFMRGSLTAYGKIESYFCQYHWNGP